MSEHSKIEWTEATWNPVRGCIKVSPGCKNCYAETFAERFRGVPSHPYENGFDPRLVPGKLLEPLSWASAKTVFVNSMSDLFQDAVPDDYIGAVAEVMLSTPWHTYQILTKRSTRLAALLRNRLRRAALAPHIWWGVSVEDRRHGVPRIDHLRKTPARTRFLSIEPLLEHLGGDLDLSGIDWVIVGGESGPGARPMERDWVEAIRQSCRVAHAQFFFKQWGGVQKGKHGRLLNARTYDEMPPRSTIGIPTRAERLDLIRALARVTDGWSDTPLVQIIPRRIVA
jgi:protein gp37